VNSGGSERLAVPASCTAPAMLFILNDIYRYIEYSGFHSNGFSQEDTHYNFAQYFQDIIYWTQPIKTSSFCGKKNCFIIFIKNIKNSLSASLFLSGKSEEQEMFLVWPYANIKKMTVMVSNENFLFQ
jgi:hypothetical protein